MAITPDDISEGIELYNELCVLIDKHELPPSCYVASLIASIWYIFPQLDMTPEFIAEQIVTQFKKWEAKKIES